MKKCYKLAGCFTSLYFLTGVVFYVILMVNKFSAGVDWLTGFFLIFGAVGIVMIVPMIVNLFFYMGAHIACTHRACDKSCCEENKIK